MLATTMNPRLLIAALTCLCAADAFAYKIIEARYAVETPNGRRDQIVVRCDDGRVLTLPWEARPGDACAETAAARAAMRDSAVQNINEAHRWCVRGNAREICEEVRANALKAVTAATPSLSAR